MKLEHQSWLHCLIEMALGEAITQSLAVRCGNRNLVYFLFRARLVAEQPPALTINSTLGCRCTVPPADHGPALANHERTTEQITPRIEGRLVKRGL
jgi:hypothetical protein